MHSPLATLRHNAPRIPASRFLAANPGCWIQYFDDTPAKNPLKALSARTFDPVVARRKQREQCAVCFSIQAFGDSRTKEELLCVRTLGVDVDLIAPPARATMPIERIDRRKDEYLRQMFLPFPLKPHWITETRHGFHLLFRVLPQRDPDGIREVERLNRQVVRLLRGDPNAVLLTQLFRVPGTLQFKIPEQPFSCRLLLDNSADIDPYPLATVRDVLDAWEPFAKREPTRQALPLPQPARHAGHTSRWQEGLHGVAEGQRNATAASLVGKILGRLPEELWATAGWGGLKEWNCRNTEPLPERELRSVFESIARRELAKRQQRNLAVSVLPADSTAPNSNAER